MSTRQSVVRVLVTVAACTAGAVPWSAGAEPAFSAKRLVQAFRGPRELPRQKALQEFARFHMDEPAAAVALAEAVGAARDAGRADAGVFAAIRLLGRLEDEATRERLLVLLGEEDPRFVVAAADALAGRRDFADVGPLVELRERDEFRRSYAFRHAVVTAVGGRPSADAVDFLVELMPTLDGQLKYEAARRLAAMTGQNHGGLSERWAEWWARNREGFTPGAAPVEVASAVPLTGAREAPAAMPWVYEPPEFFGTSIYAKRVVFVLDTSRSMASSVDGKTRLELVREELEEAIEGLPSDAVFDVLAYNTEVTQWKGELVPADPVNKREAALFAELLEPDRKTACYDALETGLLHRGEPEVMLFLSDGEPTAGRIVDQASIVEAVTAGNALRRVTIDVIGVDARDQDLKFLEELARRNFGELKVVR